MTDSLSIGTYDDLKLNMNFSFRKIGNLTIFLFIENMFSFILLSFPQFFYGFPSSLVRIMERKSTENLHNHCLSAVCCIRVQASTRT